MLIFSHLNELRDKFSRSKIKEIRKKFYKKEKIEQYFKELEKKNISKKKLKKVKKHYEKQKKNKQYLKKLKKSLNKSRKYYDYDHPDYEGIREVKKLYDKIDENYYKAVKNKGAFNDNYIEYESRRDKDKNLSLQEYLDLVRPYLRDMINNHEIRLLWN